MTLIPTSCNFHGPANISYSHDPTLSSINHSYSLIPSIEQSLNSQILHCLPLDSFDYVSSFTSQNQSFGRLLVPWSINSLSCL